MQNGTPEFRAFTMSSSILVNRLVSDATVVFGENKLVVKALWDTGATGTCISAEVVQKLSLIPTGKKNICTPSGTKEVNTYLLNIVLPNNVGIKDVEVCDTDIGNQGIGMLIGMDIIGIGDFAVSNYNNKTIFSFRYPSKHKIDFVHEINLQNLIGKKHGKGKRKKK